MTLRRLNVLPLAVLSLLAFGTGCFTTSTMQRANTVGKGHVQFAVEPTFFGTVAKTNTTTTSGSGTTADTSATEFVGLPTVGFALRYGVTDSIDIGTKLSASGLEFMGKFQLTPPDGVVISLAPSIGGFYAAVAGSDGTSAGAGFFNFTLPVLIGIPLGKHQLILAPKIDDYMLFASDQSGGSSGGLLNVVMVGASVGMALRVTPNFQLLPEFGLLYPVYGTAAADNATSSQALHPNGFIFQTGIGLLFGGQ